MPDPSAFDSKMPLLQNGVIEQEKQLPRRVPMTTGQVIILMYAIVLYHMEYHRDDAAVFDFVVTL